MLQTAQIINTVIFLTISTLHFYWAFGSLFGKKIKSAASVVPLINGKPAFIPSTFATFVVAIGLLFFAKISGFGLVQDFGFEQFKPVIPYGNLAISIIFLVRAIGDFRLVGFFKFVGLNVRFSPFSLETNLKKSKLFEDRIYGKKISSSKFAENDSKYYSPLCIFISVLAFVIYWNLK